MKSNHPLGFTLVELLVVLAILGLLAALVGPRVLNQLGGAKSKTAVVQIADLERALEIYKIDVGRYPSTEQGLAALTTKPEGLNSWNGPYLKGQVPNDPWGKAFIYSNKNGSIEILSHGSDGVVGGEGEAADIKSR
ncbi:MAG: type II secretion system major pseudopilin GspG [Burkholderiaceae bacterium]|nr:type II secretion system major pseudopilin GspG [Burkholderiaceae bacterium]